MEEEEARSLIKHLTRHALDAEMAARRASSMGSLWAHAGPCMGFVWALSYPPPWESRLGLPSRDGTTTSLQTPSVLLITYGCGSE